MEHKGTVVLQTERLLLRRFSHDDAPDMFRNWTHDPEVTKYLRWPAHDSVSITYQIADIWARKYENIGYYQWAIVEKLSGQVFGSMGVVDQRENLGIVEVGYCIGREFWHQGYTSEALQAVVDFLFGEVKVNRIQALHDINNPNSGHVMSKCGMQREGVLRQYDSNQLGICDVAICSILREEWLLQHGDGAVVSLEPTSRYR